MVLGARKKGASTKGEGQRLAREKSTRLSRTSAESKPSRKKGVRIPRPEAKAQSERNPLVEPHFESNTEDGSHIHSSSSSQRALGRSTDDPKRTASRSRRTASGKSSVQDEFSEMEAKQPEEESKYRPTSPGDRYQASTTRANTEGRAQVIANLISVRRDGSDGEKTKIYDDVFDIGRNAGSLQYANDFHLEARHCRLLQRDGEWILRDLDTINGVYLRLREPTYIEHRGQLLLGRQVLVFERLDMDEASLNQAVEQGVLLFASSLKTPWGRIKQLAECGVYRDVFHFYRPQVVFGREDGDILFPDDEFISRKHMRITFSDEGVLVEDLGSSNGTFLKVDGEIAISNGDLLRLGDQLLRFEIV